MTFVQKPPQFLFNHCTILVIAFFVNLYKKTCEVESTLNKVDQTTLHICSKYTTLETDSFAKIPDFLPVKDEEEFELLEEFLGNAKNDNAMVSEI